MKKLSVINLMVIVALILGSCATSNDVVSNRLISKRKYNKGFHINKKGKYKDAKDNVANEDLKDEETKTASRKIKTSRATDKKVKVMEAVTATEETFAMNEATTQEPVYEYEGASSSDSAPLDDMELNTTETEVVVAEQEETSDATEKTAESASAATVDTGDPLMLVLAIILAIILPPLAIGIFDGISTMFWVDLILFIVGLGGFFIYPGLAWAAGVAAIVIAFLVIFGVI